MPLGKFYEKKDLTRSLIKGPVSLHTHVNLQIQAINPTYICPSTGCVRMNSTHKPAPACLKHESKGRKWILNLTRICDSQIFIVLMKPEQNILGRHSPIQTRKRAKIPYKRESKEFPGPSREFQYILTGTVEADNCPRQ